MEKIAWIVVLCMVLVISSPHANALTCSDVNTYMVACEPFLTNKGLLGSCCDGVKKLDAVATTTIDRETACNCLKADGTTTEGIDWEKAALLPVTCGVSLPYTISATIDCSKAVSLMESNMTTAQFGTMH
ncbi:non-specific lipid-transfer protein 2-like [Lycium ferocissimum]|uniref:non-specific lipid-transfer protein 2-like n=1 Tax=Lycium ferocissimum TaxID=112874 RepID=UPI0028161563|nr:non-specific lipid-transfer protein 2-like [Lycium ferocissimum]